MAVREAGSGVSKVDPRTLYLLRRRDRLRHVRLGESKRGSFDFAASGWIVGHVTEARAYSLISFNNAASRAPAIRSWCSISSA
jgi:hypothetical protein